MGVPKLRFREFEGEWEKRRLGDFSKKVQTKNKENLISLVLTNSAILGIVEQNDYFDKDIANSSNLEGYYIVNKDDFIYNPRISKFAQVGALNRCHLQQGVVSPLYLVFRVNKNKISLDFLEQYFKASKWHYYMYSVANYGARSDRMNILNNDFFNIPLKLPHKTEQQKIASFLNLIDKNISLHEQKLSLLKLHKKGVMQKIFSQKIRFKDENGEEFPEWEERKLEDVLEENNTKSTINNQYEILSSTKDDIVLQNEYFKRDIASKINVGYKILLKNQLVFSPQNLWLGNINVNTKYDIGLVSPSYKIYNFNESLAVVEYFKYYMKIPKMIFEYAQSSEMGASVVRRTLNMDLFMNIKIQLPHPNEQQKIASFLSSFDKNITLHEQKLQNLKNHKKGLLQSLFV